MSIKTAIMVGFHADRALPHTAVRLNVCSFHFSKHFLIYEFKIKVVGKDILFVILITNS